MPAPSELHSAGAAVALAPAEAALAAAEAALAALDAAAHGDAAALAALRAAGGDLCASVSDGTPLTVAACGGFRAALGVILGAHPPQAQLDWALTFAAVGGHRGCTDDLLAAGARPLGVLGTLGAAVIGGAPILCDILAALAAAHSRPGVRAALLAPEGVRAVGHAVRCAVRPGLVRVDSLAALLLFAREVQELLGLQQEILVVAASVICGADPLVGFEVEGGDWAPSADLLRVVGGATLADARAAVAARHPGPALDERLDALEAAWMGEVQAEELAAAIAPSVLAMQGLAFGGPPPPE